MLLLSPQAAERLVEQDFGSMLRGVSANPAASAVVAGRVMRYIGRYEAVVRGPDGRAEVAVSSVPLRVGGAATDLRLRQTPSGFVASNPLYAVTIARRLSTGARIGAFGLRVTPEGTDREGRLLGGQSVFFPDVARDVDAVVTPTIEGAEFFTVLRSRLSSSTVRYRVTLAPDETLLPSDGGAVVTRAGRALATVAAPQAQDAQGRPVEVRMSVAGHQLALTMVSRSRANIAYPVLIDPQVSLAASAPGWTFTENPGDPFVGVSPGVVDVTTAMDTDPQDPEGLWTWVDPNATWLSQAEFDDVSVTFPGFAGPWDQPEALFGVGCGGEATYIPQYPPPATVIVTQSASQAANTPTGPGVYEACSLNPDSVNDGWFYANVDKTATTAGSLSVGAILVIENTGPIPSPPTTTTTTTATTTASAPAGDDYVALGDSYSSGEGNPPFESGTDDYNIYGIPDFCHRSLAAYPNALSAFTGLPLAFYACSGANTADLLSDSDWGEAPQLNEPGIDVNTQLVTLTIGGNDAGFEPTVVACIEQDAWAWYVNHVTLGSADPDCSDSDSFYDSANAQVQALQSGDVCGLLCTTFEDIKAKAHNASVIAADYPLLFSTDPADQSCFPLDIILSPTDQDFFNQEAGLLDAEEQQAAALAGINFVDVRPEFAGHSSCDPTAWINLPVVDLNLNDILAGTELSGSFHPNAAGQAAYAQAFESFIETQDALGAPTNSADLPANPAPTSAPIGNGGGGADPPTEYGTLTVTPMPSQASAACEGFLQAGQQVQVQGSGYQPDATVAITFRSPGPSAATVQDNLETTVATLQADATGSIDAAITIPFGATGLPIGSQGDLAFLDATGAAAAANFQNQDNIAMTSLVLPTSPCALAFQPAAASIALTGNDTPYLPIGGAVFEVTGQSLPSPTTTPPTAGSFAELDATATGGTACPPTEPSGVTCSGGVLQDLVPGATYTVSQVQTPAGYLTPAATTFVASLTGATTAVQITDSAAVGNYTTGAGAQNCTLCLLGATGTVMSATGSSVITWSGPATINSTSSAAAQATGASLLSGGSLFLPGGVKLTGAGALKTPVAAASGSAVDPFSWFTYPTSTATPASLSVSGSKTTTATPGVYSSITVSGSASLTLAPGVYIVTGSISLAGSGDLSGSGATIDLECTAWPSACPTAGQGASLTVSGNGRLTLTGGAIGPGSGFVLLGDRATTNAITLSGSGAAGLTGNLYALGGILQASGNSPLTVSNGEVVAAQAAVSGSSSITVDDGSS